MQYELGVLPLSLANTDGTLRKTQKSKLFQHLESTLSEVESIPENCPKFFDGMVLLQKLPPTLRTFGELSDYLLKKILHSCSPVNFFVTDFYLEDSVKSMERDRRSAAGSLRVKVMRRDQAVPKQFSRFLRNSENKLDLLDFLSKDWSTNLRHCEVLDGKELYFTIRDQAICISSIQGRLLNTPAPELASKQEEADTKMFLCAAFASSLGFPSVNIVTVDSDVAVLSLYYQQRLDVEIYLQMGTGVREKIYKVFSNDLSDDVLKSLPAIHALSGCDSTSALVGIGKVKMFNTVCKEESFLDAAGLLGDDETVTENVFEILEELFCRLYGFKNQVNINHCRYEAITRKKKMPDPEKIPPTRDALRLHIIRCNYQVYEWKKAIDCEHIPNDPEGCGWEKSDNRLEIKWMTKKPAPEEVLEFTTCGCKKNKLSVQSMSMLCARSPMYRLVRMPELQERGDHRV